jgi:hypothetical protein
MMLVALAGWVNEQQLAVIEYLKRENRVLREQVGRRRLRFTNDQRRRLAAKGQALGRRVLRSRARSSRRTQSSAGTADSWPGSTTKAASDPRGAHA